jgi:hypothetical protein
MPIFHKKDMAMRWKPVAKLLGIFSTSFYCCIAILISRPKMSKSVLWVFQAPSWTFWVYQAMLPSLRKIDEGINRFSFKETLSRKNGREMIALNYCLGPD